MIRECHDCHRIEDAPSLIAAGGLCVPAGVFTFPAQEDWYCADCKAKYPTPQERIETCSDCLGGGQMVVFNECEGCDHACTSIAECEWCRGTGQVTTHDCNPGCDHSGLPVISVTRGGIVFSHE